MMDRPSIEPVLRIAQGLVTQRCQTHTTQNRNREASAFISAIREVYSTGRDIHLNNRSYGINASAIQSISADLADYGPQFAAERLLVCIEEKFHSTEHRS